MKLTMLKPRLGAIDSSRIKEQPPRVAGAIDRMRGSSWMALRAKVLKRDAGLCQQCMRGEKVTPASQVDHIKPLHLGGLNGMDNLEALCKTCHDAKTAREVAALHR